MKTKLLWIFLFFTSINFAQNLEIKGQLTDPANSKGLKNAVLYMVNVEDSSIVHRMITDDSGNFEITKPLGIYQLFINHPKFNEKEFYFLATEENNFFDLGSFSLPDKSTILDEVTIFAYKDPVYYKGDTLIYVADSFKTNPNAVVEDLLKKLPGIEVDKDGKIKAQGKEIARVLVDGDEFFGSDATMATRNLSANSIENVKVYEKELADASAGDDKVKVIDLTLKDDAKKGYFGKTSFATDFRRFYEGEGLINYFTPKRKLSAYLLTTNTTKTSLKWQDANKFGIELSNNYSYNEESDSWEMNENYISSEGYPLLWKTGFYYEDKISKKLKLGANYTYTDYRVEKRQNNYSQYFLQDTVYYSDFNEQTDLKSKRHELNLSVKWDIDSTQSLEILPKFNHYQTATDILSTQNYLSEEKNVMREGTTNKFLDQQGMNVKTKVTYTKNFVKKKGRRLQFIDNFTWDDFAKNTDLYYEDRLPFNNLTFNLIDQQKFEDRNILSNILVAKYTEPFTKKWSMEFYYENFNIRNDRQQRSFNNQNGIYDQVDSLTTNSFYSTKFQNVLGVSAIYNHKKINVTFGTKARNVMVDNVNLLNNTTINQNISNLLPYFKFIYKISEASRIEWNNRTSSNLPSINILQPVYDNENPNRIQVGNANILPTYSYLSNLTYNDYKPISGIWVYAGANVRYTKNDYAQSITYDAFGRSISEYRNIDMFNGVTAWGGFGVPIYKKVLYIGPNIQYNLNNTANYINNVLTRNVYNRPGGEVFLKLDLEKISSTFVVGYAYTMIKNVINPLSNQSNNTLKISFDFRYQMPLKFILETDFEYYQLKGLTADFNTSYFLWNASIGKKFLKRDQLRIDLVANDILNQNRSISRTNMINMIVDSRKLIITRYFLFKLTYQFNSSKIKENDEESHF